MKLLSLLFWEFLQNLPLIAGLVASLQLWQQDRYLAAVACVGVSSFTGSLIIRATESRIVANYRESLRVTIANIAVMAVLMLAAVAYLLAGWSSWQTDLFVGVLAGVVLGAAQGLAARKNISINHCVAFACAGPLALIGPRVLAAVLPVLPNILIVTVVVTLVVGLIDYGPFRSFPELHSYSGGE